MSQKTSLSLLSCYAGRQVFVHLHLAVNADIRESDNFSQRFNIWVKNSLSFISGNSLFHDFNDMHHLLSNANYFISCHVLKYKYLFFAMFFFSLSFINGSLSISLGNTSNCSTSYDSIDHLLNVQMISLSCLNHNFINILTMPQNERKEKSFRICIC